jgi:hypothetical protein
MDNNAAGFDALVKRCDKCIDVVRGYVDIPVSNITYFNDLYPFVTYLLISVVLMKGRPKMAACATPETKEIGTRTFLIWKQQLI